MNTQFNKKMTTEELYLNSIQSGMEIVTITPTDDGFKYGTIKIVGDYSETHKQWRLRCPLKRRDYGLLPPDGAGYMFIHRNHDTLPSFYYSANPKHIEAAKIAHEHIRIEQEIEKQKTKEQLIELKHKIYELLKEYGADIYPVQLSGDDQGVEVEVCISIKNQEIQLEED
jgi:hypothetical protein